MKLLDAKGQPVLIGSRATTFRGESVIVVGITPPHKAGSTGRVHVRFESGYVGEYFPGVIDAHWEQTREESVRMAQTSYGDY